MRNCNSLRNIFSIYCVVFYQISTIYRGIILFSHYPIVIPTMKPLAEKTATETSET